MNETKISRAAESLEKFVNTYNLRKDAGAKITVIPSATATCINPETGVMKVHSFLLEDIDTYIKECIFVVRHEVGHFNHSFKYWDFFQDFLMRRPSELRELVMRRLDDIRIDSREAERDPVLRKWFANCVKSFLNNCPEAFKTTTWESQVITHLYMMANGAPKELLWSQDCVDFILHNGLLSLAKLAAKAEHFSQLVSIGNEIVRRMGGDRNESKTSKFLPPQDSRNNEGDGEGENQNQSSNSGTSTSQSDAGGGEGQSYDQDRQEKSSCDEMGGYGHNKISAHSSQSECGNADDALDEKSYEIIERINRERQRAIKEYQQNSGKEDDDRTVKVMQSNSIYSNSNSGFSLDEIARIMNVVSREFAQKIIDSIKASYNEYKLEPNYSIRVYEIFKTWFKVSAHKDTGRINPRRINRLLSSKPAIFESTRWEVSKSKFDIYCLLDVSGSMSCNRKSIVTANILGHFLRMFQELIVRFGCGIKPIRIGVGTFSSQFNELYALTGNHITTTTARNIHDKFIRLVSNGGATLILDGVINSVKRMGNVNTDNTYYRRMLLIITDAQISAGEIDKVYDICVKAGIIPCFLCITNDTKCPIYGTLSPTGKTIYNVYINPYRVIINDNLKEADIEKLYKSVFYKAIYDAVHRNTRLS